MQQDNRYKQLEEALLMEADLLIEKAKSQGEKALYNLFKSEILKKYKNDKAITIKRQEIISQRVATIGVVL